MKPKRNLMPLDVAMKQGWKALTTGFCEDELNLAESICDYMESEGGRCALVLIVPTASLMSVMVPTVEIWRPVSELETVEQTQQRLKRLRLDAR